MAMDLNREVQRDSQNKWGEVDINRRPIQHFIPLFIFLSVRGNDAVRYRLTNNQLLTTHALQRDTLVWTRRYDLFCWIYKSTRIFLLHTRLTCCYDIRTAGAKQKSKIQGVNLWLTLENFLLMEKADGVAGTERRCQTLNWTIKATVWFRAGSQMSGFAAFAGLFGFWTVLSDNRINLKTFSGKTVTSTFHNEQFSVL